MIGSAVITLGITILSGIFGFFGLLLALNGFMGQERAVNTALVTYIILAVVIILLVTIFSALTAGFLQTRFEWRSAFAVIASSFGFAIIGVVMHFVVIIIAAIVADQMRTTR
jgi:uncharacterized membrane protein